MGFFIGSGLKTKEETEEFARCPVYTLDENSASDFGLIRLRYLTLVWFVVVLIERRVDSYRGLKVKTALGDEGTRRKLWYHPVGGLI